MSGDPAGLEGKRWGQWRQPTLRGRYTALAGTRLGGTEIWRALRVRRFGYLDARRSERADTYQGEGLEAEAEQGGGHRSRREPLQARGMDTSAHRVVRRWGPSERWFYMVNTSWTSWGWRRSLCV